MLFYPTRANDTLGRAGVVILIVTFLLILVSVVIVGWNVARPLARNRRFRFAERRESDAENQQPVPLRQTRAKISSVYYTLCLFLQYVPITCAEN
jgi:hypothetical protein